MTKLESLLEDFENAVSRLEEILRETKNDIIRDSAIKRFEITFDLSWKTTKAFMEEQFNITCLSPKLCFREAFRVGLVEYDDFWLKIAANRNYAAHAYSEVLAEKIYKDLPESLSLFKKLLSAIKSYPK